ncbi:MAG: anti-sigma factor [Thermoanaerobaculia bacterium]
MTHEQLEGIAALDAIGAATVEEQQEFQSHADDCAYCRSAIDEFAEAASMMALNLVPVRPPKELRSRILAAIERGDDTANTTNTNVVTLRRMRIRPWWLATAATLFLALWGWREMGIRVLHERSKSQSAEISRLAAENTLLKSQRDKLSTDFAAVSSPQTRVFSLAGQHVAPAANARVFLSPEQRRAVVFFYNLPANPSDRSYQLWIIRADQAKPQSAGVFDATNGNATVSVENVPVGTELKALAVTLEPKGGVDQPTNSNFIVMGRT